MNNARVLLNDLFNFCFVLRIHKKGEGGIIMYAVWVKIKVYSRMCGFKSIEYSNNILVSFLFSTNMMQQIKNNSNKLFYLWRVGVVFSLMNLKMMTWWW